jgi:hypothetical protein
MVPDTLKSVSFIEKDTRKFPDTNGWAYAQFLYDAASDSFMPHGSDAKCGYDCSGKGLHFYGISPAVNGEWTGSRERLLLGTSSG